ncbi:FAD:protein FMN transferase [bacterium]|nr:FAD:protein FMN transferase [bacterium]
MLLKKVSIFYLLFICASASSAWSQSWSHATKRLQWLGAPMNVTVWAEDQVICATALQISVAELKRLEQAYSAIRQGSVVNQLNQFGGERPIKVNAETRRLLQWAETLSEKTKGAFDITTTSYKWQYGFGQSDFRLPTYLHMRQIMPLVNYKLIAVYPKDKTVLFRKDGVQIDFDILLVSHAFNRLQLLLKKKKIKSLRLQIGKNTMVLGNLPEKLSSLEIHTPGKKAELLARLLLRPGKVLQADVYTRAFQKEGKRIHPYLDAKAGKPAKHCQQATLYLPLQAKLDIPAGVLMLLPPKESLQLIDSIPQAKCLLLDYQSRLHYSVEWKNPE